MPRVVAILRGINVSDQKPLKMAELRASLTAAGYGHVATYVQSGNVAFNTDETDEAALVAALHDRIERDFGYDLPVLVRTAAELERVRAGNPFLAQGADPARLHVTFLAVAPTPAQWAQLVPPANVGADTFAPGQREIYVHTPGGYGRSKLNNNWFEGKLGIAATTRNWKSVGALAAMTARREG